MEAFAHFEDAGWKENMRGKKFIWLRQEAAPVVKKRLKLKKCDACKKPGEVLHAEGIGKYCWGCVSAIEDRRNGCDIWTGF